MTNLIEYFGIEVVDLNSESATIKMEIDEKSHQPYGYVHGGMNAVLVETVASIGANHNLEGSVAMGLEVNVNHLRAKREGTLIAKARKVHLGRRTAVYSVDIFDEQDKHIATGRCTMQIVEM
ncbi:MAG TPA: PaaI family thioesterase [Jeotgalicoccus sp.]|nr:PaaI family thioesterase [Jeotgalicoccus sp.]